ncbi:uncharacterized protein [Salminus brasiliensis]|uniref:uncharacterized protein n=1 Tax=Salminus brasiliensis TaxID=930266 RepID=UPI003B8396BC
MLIERVHVLLRGMTYVQCSCLLCSVWMLLTFLSAVQTDNTTHIVHQGKTTIINCDYNKTIEREVFRVILSRERSLCSYIYQYKSWNIQSCKDNIRLIWIPETEEISYELLNLQLNDSGVYKCAVERHVPPPVKCLGLKKTFIHMIARPAVSLSCVKGPDGVPTALCTSEGFYPAAVEQAWIRDGDFITYLNTSHTDTQTQHLNTSAVHWNSSINTDGSHSLSSYLQLLTHTTRQVMFSCWVNHSSLNQPIAVNMSSTECSEEQGTNLLIITGITSAVLTGTILVIAVHCHCLRRCRTHSRPPAERSQPSPHSQGQFDTYSTLGNHQPVPCRINSSQSTTTYYNRC